MDSLGPRIKELRLEANLNKAALARRVGVSDVTISYWESGAIKQIGHERLVALAQALGCPLSRLIESEERGRASPLYLRRLPPAPWQDPGARAIELPFELVPAQRWEGECYLLTPAPGEPFDGHFEIYYAAPCTADGRYAKLQLLSYYCPGARPGCLTFRYVYQGAGGRSLR